MDQSRSIYGIDFSEAKDAGNKIWIAKGVPNGERLLVSECYTGSGIWMIWGRGSMTASQAW